MKIIWLQNQYVLVSKYSSNHIGICDVWKVCLYLNVCLFLALGESACIYMGTIDFMCYNNHYNYKYKYPLIPPDKLPKECSAFIFESLFILSNFSVFSGCFEYDDGK